jgi:hypothetical protein
MRQKMLAIRPNLELVFPKTRGSLIKTAKKSLSSQANALDFSSVLQGVAVLSGKPPSDAPCLHSRGAKSQDKKRRGAFRVKLEVLVAGTTQSYSSSDPKIARILSMKRARNWDGEGAEAITDATCNAAVYFRRLVEAWSLRAPDWIAPSTAGAIGFTWRTKTEQINVQVQSVGEGGCIIRRSGAAGRFKVKCSIEVAKQQLSPFLASD